MSLFEELIEDKEGDKKIIKSFKPKDTLSPQIFEGGEDGINYYKFPMNLLKPLGLNFLFTILY